jgi:hypothetical protein
MSKLKDMWSELSKPGKWFMGALIVIIILVVANYIV